MTCDFGLRSVGDKTAEGKGDVAANREEAFKWYLKAAEQGHPDAQDRLAKCYYKGDGIAKDTKKAAAWFLKAAEQFGRIIHAMQVRTYAKNLKKLNAVKSKLCVTRTSECGTISSMAKGFKNATLALALTVVGVVASCRA